MYSTLAMPSLKPQDVNFTSFPSCHILSVKRTCWGGTRAPEHQGVHAAPSQLGGSPTKLGHRRIL
jgi:hypothetical protein